MTMRPPAAAAVQRVQARKAGAVTDDAVDAEIKAEAVAAGQPVVLDYFYGAGGGAGAATASTVDGVPNDPLPVTAGSASPRPR